MANKFVGFLETAGKDVEKGLVWAVKEAPVVDPLINLIFPGSQIITGPATVALNLIQNAVISIEQKYAAAGVQSGTGVQKAAEVLALTGPAVTALLTEAKVPTADQSYISALITAIVGVLNVSSPPPTTVAAAA